MRVSLINIGDCARVIYDERNLPIYIGIGKVVEADMPQATLDNIYKFKRTETLLIAPAGEGIVPPELQAIVDLMSIIESENYDQLLQRLLRIAPIDHATKARPTRAQMRMQLRGMINDYVTEHSKVKVKDDVDPDSLQKEQVERPRRSGRR